MLKRFVALACTALIGAAFFVTSSGCGKPQPSNPPANAPANPPANNPAPPVESGK